MNVIGVSGLPGSGKNMVSKIAEKRSMIVINMGDLVRQEAKKRNEETGKVAVDLRKEQGEYVLAKLTIQKIKNLSNLAKNSEDKTNKDSKHKTSADSEDNSDKNNGFYIIEGIRSPFEVELFRNNFDNFKLISIFSSPKTRFDRLKNRKRDDDFQKYDDFLKRDQRELDFGIGNVIASSDFTIINEGSLEDYETQINNLFEDIILK